MGLSKQKTIQELETLAIEVLKLKQERESRRPLLIEFCGSPKSGKSTTITSLNIFLKRNGFKTVVLTERASICPIDNKTDPFFNIWTLTSAVSEIIEHLDQGDNSVDVIIADRGIFDSLCWFEWLNMNPEGNPHLNDKTYADLKGFILMDMWRRSIDLIYVFQVEPSISIIREYANLLTERRGSIMTESVLEGFNKAIESTLAKYGDQFRKVINIKTDTEDYNENPNRVGYTVTKNVLKDLKDLLVEKIGFFDSRLKRNLKTKILPISKISNLKLKFENRDKVEMGNSIQPIAIAVITNKKRDKLLVVKKSTKRTPMISPESGKLLLYIGGHTRIEDQIDSKTIKTIAETLHREIYEEIGESISIKNAKPFLIYTPNNYKSAKHLAVCFIIEMDLEEKKIRLISDEFTMKKGTSKSGLIMEVKEIINGLYTLEPWSIQILQYVFNQKYLRRGTGDLFEDDI